MDKHYWKTQPYDFIDTNDNLWSMLGDDSELCVGREVLLIMQQQVNSIQVPLILLQTIIIM